MTRAEMFARACEQMARQGWRRSAENGRCLYRGPDGMRCAVGALIPDALYSEGMEGSGYEVVRDHPALEAAVLGATFDMPEEEYEERFWALRDLQCAHDQGGGDPTTMRHNFRALADEWALPFPYAEVAQ